MNERFLNHILTEYLHPVSFVSRFAIAGGIYTVIIDGPQELPHREFIHQRLEFILERDR